MVVEIVKQAIHIKLTCQKETPLLSPAEFAYSCGYALKLTGSRAELMEKIGVQTTIGGMKELLFPELEKIQSEYDDNPREKRLIHLLLTCKVEGEITEEVHRLFEMGLE